VLFEVLAHVHHSVFYVTSQVDEGICEDCKRWHEIVTGHWIRGLKAHVDLLSETELCSLTCAML
jgi:hypothetical protein